MERGGGVGIVNVIYVDNCRHMTVCCLLLVPLYVCLPVCCALLNFCTFVSYLVLACFLAFGCFIASYSCAVILCLFLILISLVLICAL